MRHAIPVRRSGRVRAFLAPLIVLTLPTLAGTQTSTQQKPAPQHTRTSKTDVVLLGRSLTILVSPGEPGPVHQAAEDLAADFQRVTGTRPSVAGNENSPGAPAILIGAQARLPEDMRSSDLTKPESFSISMRKARAGRPATTSVLSGADLRGTIFSVY